MSYANRQPCITVFYWRLRFFATETFNALVRRWQVSLFLLLMFSPALTPPVLLLHLLGLPVLMMLEQGQFEQSIFIWLLMVFIAISWSTLQQKALTGSSVWLYLSRFLSARQQTLINYFVLLVADLPLLLFFIGADMTLIQQKNLALVANICAILVLGLQLPIIQLLMQQTFYRVLIFCLIADSMGLWLTASGVSVWCLVLVVMLSSVCGLQVYIRLSGTKVKSSPSTWRFFRLSAEQGLLLNLLCLNLRHVGRKLTISRYLAWLCGLILPLFLTEQLRKQGVQAYDLMLIADLCLIPVIHNISELVFDLESLHQPMQVLFCVYQVSVTKLHIINFMLLQLLCFLLCLPVIAVLYYFQQSFTVLAVLPIALLLLAVFMLINYKRIAA